jgi:ABC-type multidrug transport system ATPase subunit
MSEVLLLGPSGSGKTILLQNLILNIYRNCFERIYIFSPSVDVDTTWAPVKKYIEEDLKIDVKREKTYFDHYNPEDLMHIISTQHKVTDYMKKQKQKKLYSILIIVDDFADDPSFSQSFKILAFIIYTEAVIAQYRP